jgi:hypothetical protein
MLDIDLDFSTLKPFSKPFKYDGKDYVLHEASGGNIVEYDQAENERRKFGPDGKFLGVKNFAELKPILVSLCITNKDGTSVSLETIKAWPHKVVSKLYEAIKTVSDLQTRPSEIELLIKALGFEDGGCPCTISQLSHYVMSLGDDYKDLKDAFKPTAEELAKNGQGGSTPGSS